MCTFNLTQDDRIICADMARDLLIEIGTEELPASMVVPGAKQLLDGILKALHDAHIKHGSGKWFATPRRLAVLVKDVAEKQDVIEKEVVGPPEKVAFDSDGNPTKAAIGFARSAGVDVSDLYVINRGSKRYVAAKVTEGGTPTTEILKTAIPQAISSIKFPKSMRWNDSFRFARPIRWIVALFGKEVIPFEVAGVSSGKRTRGHRLISNREIEIDSPENYENLLENVHVIADFEKRRELVRRKASEAAAAVGGRPIDDPELLDEVTNLVEWPSAVLGSFDSKYLQLPDVVVITAMKQHQRYFAVVDEKGRLMNHFVAIANNLDEYADVMRPGLEKVLRARLEDAGFYYKEDLKKRLEERVEELKGIVWREGLGSVYDKVMRIKELAMKLASDDETVDIGALERGALLSKTDLTTEMIRDGKEFTKLEGVIGMEYALAQGENEKVARIIFEHHLPRFSGDRLPELREAAWLAVADRLDTIAGIMSTGYEVSGSQDPLGLRRLAYGLIDVILGHELRFDMRKAAELAAAPFGNHEFSSKIVDFILGRFENYLEEKESVRYDLVDAVIASGITDLVNLRKRALALQKLMESEPEIFSDVVIGQKRVANILEKTAELPEIDPQLFEKDEERTLYEIARKVEPEVRKAVESEDFDRALKLLLELRAPIDSFFDNVFVMVDDPKLRLNRLALLNFVRTIFKLYGDFSKIAM